MYEENFKDLIDRSYDKTDDYILDNFMNFTLQLEKAKILDFREFF